MTREEAKVLLPIIQAFAEGKVIECRTKPSASEPTASTTEHTCGRRLMIVNTISRTEIRF